MGSEMCIRDRKYTMVLALLAAGKYEFYSSNSRKLNRIMVNLSNHRAVHYSSARFALLFNDDILTKFILYS